MNLNEMGRLAKASAKILRSLKTNEKNAILLDMAHGLDAHRAQILKANQVDLKAARATGLSEALLERLTINDKRIDEMINGLHQVISLDDPVGTSPQMWVNENGLKIGERRVPIGVIGIIYESRPNVTVDAASLCLKTGNAVILKGGSDALLTNQALMHAIAPALSKHGLSNAVQLIASPDRSLVKNLLECTAFVDCIIPRGGAGLIRFVVQNAKVPVIETGAGNCHIFIDAGYTPQSAIEIVLNAKVQRPGACNAVETLLIHESTTPALIKPLVSALNEAKVTVYACEKIQKHLLASGLDFEPALEAHWDEEFLDYKLAIKEVLSLDEALDHIEAHSTKHSEAILTHQYENAQKFLDAVDSAAVYVNASTRFTDGSAFGFGAEIGISTQKLHARGPMGLKALTSTKYIVYGEGQIRP